MKTVNFLKPEKLIEYFDEEVKRILVQNEVYDVEAYGWLDAETVDPKYYGYAAWVISPKVEFDFAAYWDQKPFTQRPENTDIGMMASGHDFFEMMKAAYLMIGQALFFHCHREENLGTSYASASLTGAVVQLTIAADRIRDYYAYALTRESLEEYAGKDRKKKTYSKLFEDAISIVSGYEGQSDELIGMVKFALGLACDIQEKRKHRNKLVHQLASHYSRAQKRFLEQQQASFDGKEIETSEERFDLADDLSNVLHWYKQLVELGNVVLSLEVRTRNLA